MGCEDPARADGNYYAAFMQNPLKYVDWTGLAVRLLTEIAAERGLSVSWNGGSGSGWAVTVDNVTITLNQQHANGDWLLNLDGFSPSGDQLSLHASDNKIYIDDEVFNCNINDGSGVTSIWGTSEGLIVGSPQYYKESLQTAAVITGGIKGGGYLIKGIIDVGRKMEANNWGNPDTLQDHYNRHGSDFGSANPNDYANNANNFYNNRGNFQVKVDSSGVTRVYDPNTNTFGSYNANGTTKTFFKPDLIKNPNYWADQPGILQ